ncbi:APC family permease [Lysobacter enzymogenes]|uniref:APC family permease n=1 Tax=Lysobacter enzymogenes TaxID=69 RepID=UPI00099CF9E6|nr:APC family permease [Lysobacter enzymogenes]UZW60696.1 APC family permease [Lysobacter enzymogenes]
MTAPPSSPAGLRQNALGLWTIVFFVIATNGPLTALVGVVSTAILMGNGIGVPAAFLIAGVIYLVFSVGFVAMGRYIRNAGAFYAYVANGLGRPLGTAAAFLAIVAYAGLQFACYGLIGFFGANALAGWGLALPWWVVGLAVAALVQLCSIRNVVFNGRFLGLLMLAELAVVAIFDVAVLAHGGPEGFSLASFRPEHVLVPGLGATFVFVAGSFMGFETTAIYAEEAREPERTVPAATYIAVVLIAVTLTLSSWLLIVSFGPSQVLAAAAKDPGGLWFDRAGLLVGPLLGDAINVLLITSLFAVILSFQNTLSRYLFALAREGLMPVAFARTHARHHTPYLAGYALTALVVALLLLCGLAGADPMTLVLPLGSAPAALGILAVQALTSLAVIGFFRRQPRHTNLWQRLIAPALSGAAMLVGVALIVRNMHLLTGGESAFNTLIPLGMLGVGLAGLGLALWLRSHRPERYARLARLLEEV